MSPCEKSKWQAGNQTYTCEEYLRMEERSKIGREFVNGEIIDMSGGTTTHNQITVNVAFALETLIRKAKLPCRSFVNDVELQLLRANMFTYPDGMLICGKIEFAPGRKDVVLNPVVIVQVLSESTSNYDRARKFAAYRQIPPLQEYVMNDQAGVSVEMFRRDKIKFWIFQALEELKNTLRPKSVEIEIPLAAIYEGVELTA